MVRNKLSALRVAGLFCLGLLAGIVQAAGELATPVRIGVLAYRGAEQAEREWQAHAAYLTAKLPAYAFRIVPLDYNRPLNFPLTPPASNSDRHESNI